MARVLIGCEFSGVVRDENAVAQIILFPVNAPEMKPAAQRTVPIPASLAINPAFGEAWRNWVDHLKQKRKPPTTHTQELQLRKLSTVSPEQAIEAIEVAIERGWQSVFPREPAQPAQQRQKTMSVWELKAVVEAKQKQADALKHKHSFTDAFGDTWDNDAARAAWRKLRTEISELNNRIATQA